MTTAEEYCMTADTRLHRKSLLTDRQGKRAIFFDACLEQTK